MAQIPPFFLDCVVAIGNEQPDGSVSWVGSAFFYGDFVEALDETTARYRTYLVTNRHVVEALTKPTVRLNPEGALPARQFDLDPEGWVCHADPEVDVAVMAISWDTIQNEGISAQYFLSDRHALTLDRSVDEGVSEGDDLFLLGFPMGLVGGPRSAVIVRHGVIARIVDCQNGVSKSFMADGYVFPGNSGGPVVTRAASSGIVNTKVPNAAYLVGIVASYVPYEDVAVSQQTGRPRVVFSENSGLTNVFPVDRINETIAAFTVSFPQLDQSGESSADAGSDDDQMAAPVLDRESRPDLRGRTE